MRNIVGMVLEQALQHSDAKDYLPDESDIDNAYLNRKFLFSVVNTLKPGQRKKNLRSKSLMKC